MRYQGGTWYGLRMTTYSITAYDREGTRLWLNADLDGFMSVDNLTPREVVDMYQTLLPAWSIDLDRTDDGFQPAYVAYYEVRPSGTWNDNWCEIHVPTSSDHSRCTHARTPSGRAACRRARS